MCTNLSPSLCPRPGRRRAANLSTNRRMQASDAFQLENDGGLIHTRIYYNAVAEIRRFLSSKLDKQKVFLPFSLVVMSGRRMASFCLMKRQLCSLCDELTLFSPNCIAFPGIIDSASASVAATTVFGFDRKGEVPRRDEERPSKSPTHAGIRERVPQDVSIPRLGDSKAKWINTAHHVNGTVQTIVKEFHPCIP